MIVLKGSCQYQQKGWTWLKQRHSNMMQPFIKERKFRTKRKKKSCLLEADFPRSNRGCFSPNLHPSSDDNKTFRRRVAFITFCRVAIERILITQRLKPALSIVGLAVRHPGTLDIFGMKIGTHWTGFQVNILFQTKIQTIYQQISLNLNDKGHEKGRKFTFSTAKSKYWWNCCLEYTAKGPAEGG